ncbi:MAG: M1 family metallopeptidase, partial [Candidatus Zixiibacteriota bacterium]
MKKKINYAVFALAAIVLFYITSLSETEDLSNSYDSYSPAEIHKIMGEMKAGNLERQKAFTNYALTTKSLISQEEYDVRFYRVNLNVDDDNGIIYGQVLIEAEALIDNADSIEVDLFDNIVVDSVYDSNGQLNFLHSSDKLLVELDKEYLSGEIFSFSVAYHGHPTGTGLDGFSFDTNAWGNKVIASLSEPYSARSWWPCKDRTDDKADSMDIIVTVDTALYCASNGTLIDTVVNGDGTWTFFYQVRYPIVTYLFSVAISNYTVWTDWYNYSPTDSMELVHHVYPARYVYSLSKYGMSPYILQVLSQNFGPYPFLNEKYGHANFEWGGGMEHQTITSMTGGDFGFKEAVVVHEAAHQWWGDMITCGSWHHIWLNEGFASYAEALYYETKNGKLNYHAYMDSMKFINGGTIYIYDTTNVWNIFGSIVYDKGAWVLHMLRKVVGDENFFNIFDTYYNSEFKHGSAVTDDFKNICETVSGMDLNAFFEQWIYGTYYPRYYWESLTEYNSKTGGYNTYVSVRQGQPAPPYMYTMPIDLVFNYSSGTDTVTVNNEAVDTIYIIGSAQPPTNVQLDPLNWILKEDYNSTWTYHQIPFGLSVGHQYVHYLDSIVVKGGSGENRYSIISGSLPDGFELDSITGHIEGIPLDSGTYVFEIRTDEVNKLFTEDIAEYTLTIAAGTGTPGDADNNDAVNLLDITFLIGFLYKDGNAPFVPILADPNNSCTINIL